MTWVAILRELEVREEMKVRKGVFKRREGGEKEEVKVWRVSD